MNFTQTAIQIFEQSANDYHILDHVDTPIQNPYPEKSINHYLYLKNWIDAVQWHLEDIIRDPKINPTQALEIKRRIDQSNQERTDLVEMIDSYFLTLYKDIKPTEQATFNTESPAWAIDRLSILILKIYHMQQEANRPDATDEHKNTCQKKLDTLLTQRLDLKTAIEQLLEDLEHGKKYMKIYKQMKMYNDPSLNPVLYGGK